jgi:predicted dehydrogenase
MALIQACRDAKVTASVVSQRRFETAFERLREYLRDGVAGPPVFVDFTLLAARGPAYFAAGSGWRSGPDGGVTMNLLIHTVDRLLRLLGPVDHVQATLAPAPAPGSPDRRATLLLRFVQGAQAVLRGSTEFDTTWGETLSITGSRGTLIMQNGDVRVMRNPLGHETRRERARRLAADVLPRARPPGDHGGLARQLADFVAAVRAQAEPAVTLDDGLAALRVVLAAHESHATGRTIRLAPGPDRS